MIYLDNAATTRPSESALKKANIYLTEKYFNPSAKYRHGIGLTGELQQSREALLRAVGLKTGTVIFTSCGSEADNTAVFCHSGKGKCVTTEGEHSAVIASFKELSSRGVETALCPIDKCGKVNVEKFLSMIDERTAFVSVMHVNNETGAVNDINAIAKRVKEIAPRCIFHSDGVQALGKIPVRLSPFVDLYSVSAHKVGGLKGVGALISQKATAVHPFIFGGGQEGGLRSGTENVFGIKNFEYALTEKLQNLQGEYNRISGINKQMRARLSESGFTVISGEDASPYVLSVSAGAVRGEVLLHMLEEQGVLLGTGSACSSKDRFSRVLRACGYGEDVLDGVLRISFSQETTAEEVERATELLIIAADKLRKVMKVNVCKK
ncbi:MAG: cysteine desulfurase [Clostridiales bacterium]|nr:cysteine desulfurase [Clostridiales bacterium]